MADELHRIARAETQGRSGSVAGLDGDRVVAVFDGVDDGVEAALALRSAILGSDAARAAQVSVRIGVHVGEVVRTHDGKVRGDAVAVASGIASHAEAGQVVLSDVAYRLLRDRSALDLEELGAHKGVGEPMELYGASPPGESGGDGIHELLEDTLAPLQLLDLRDEGGMGEIYLARDPSLRRTLAVKVLRSELAEDPAARRRFFREAQVIAGLSHPNVIGVHSVGELPDGTPYFVMDYVEGGSLADRLERDGPLPAREVKRVLGEVASALKAAHARGVVHRDIKASNILFDAETGRSLVTDWGIAALDPTVTMAPETRLTRTGMFVGSPEYMSPEQLAGDDVGSQTDLYSLGLLGFELATGQGPFPEDSPRGIMIAHLRENPPRLSEIAKGIDAELDTLVARCLSKIPSDRPTAEEVAQRLAPEGQAVLEWPPPGLEGLRDSAARPLRDLTWAVLLGLAAAVLLEVPVAHVVAGGTYGLVVLASLLTVVGLGLGLLGAWRTFLLGRRIRAAGDLGYGWRTLLDALADARGDTGSVVAGVREYAGLSKERRVQLRNGRSYALVLHLAILLLLVPTALLLVTIGPKGDLFSLGGAVVLGLPLVGSLLGVTFMRGREVVTVGRARKALRIHRTPRQVLRSLVEPWYASLRLVSGGSGPPSETGRPWVGVGIASGSLAVLLLTLLVGLPVFFAGVLGSLRSNVDLPRYGFVDQRWQRARVVENLRVPVDSSLSVEEASALAWGMTVAARGAKLPAGGKYSAPQESVRLPGWHPDELSARDNPFEELADSLVIIGSRGLTSAQRSWIRQNTTHAVFDALSHVAEAPALDMVGARHVGSIPDTGLEPPSAPWISELGYWTTYRAALLVSEGAAEQAERELREVLSVGFLLVDQPTPSESMVGVLMIEHARDEGLLPLYELTGRGGQARAIRAQTADVDSAYSRPTSMDVGYNAEDAQARAITMLGDEEIVRGLRWEMLIRLSPSLSCRSPGRVISGPDEKWRTAVAAAREELVRYPGEEKLFDWAQRWPERVRSELPQGRLVNMINGLGRFSGAVLGSEWVPACTALGLVTLEDVIPWSWRRHLDSAAAEWSRYLILMAVLVGLGWYAARRLLAWNARTHEQRVVFEPTEDPEA